tara:strand:+ start:303 stop:560 length:258 start_codon:yes stop_codon:yes gene_type:complete
MAKKLNFSISSLFSAINITVFLAAFLLGLVFIYFFDDKKTITVYPTPHNLDTIEFKDKADNCYSYDIVETKCPDEKNLIETLPIV